MSEELTDLLVECGATPRWVEPEPKDAGPPLPDAIECEQWRHCTPELLASGIDCSSTLRRPCELGVGHDHFVAPSDSEAALPEAESGFHLPYDEAVSRGRVMESAVTPPPGVADVIAFYAESARQFEKLSRGEADTPPAPATREVLLCGRRFRFGALVGVEHWTEQQPDGHWRYCYAKQWLDRIADADDELSTLRSSHAAIQRENAEMLAVLARMHPGSRWADLQHARNAALSPTKASE